MYKKRKEPRKMVSVRLPAWLCRALDTSPNKTRAIEHALIETYNLKESDYEKAD